MIRTIIDPAEMAAAFAEAAEVVRNGSREQRSGRVRPVGPVTALRQSLGLPRKEFAERFHVPLATLDGWELGTIEPDAVAKALLALIEANPEMVARLLAEKVPTAAE